MVNDFNINRMNPFQVKQYVDRIVNPIATGQQGQNIARISKNAINTLYNNPVVNMEEVINTASKAKKAIPYLPIAGDLLDIGAGIRSVAQGHPYIGAGQIGLGAAGLATLGGGSVIKGLAKAGVNKAGRKLAANTMRAIAKNQGKVNVVAPLGLEALKYIQDDGNQQQIEQPEVQVDNNNMPPSQPIFDEIDIPNNIPSIEQIIASAQGNQLPLDGYDLSNIPQPNTAVLQDIGNQPSNTGDLSLLLDMYNKQLKEKNQPYIDALQNYIDNYGEYTKGSRNAQRFYTALAGLSGNQGYKDLAKQYDPMVLEANRINLIKALQESKAGNIDALNEIVGNASIAQNLGLPVESALANKNLLNAYTSQQKALLGLQGKMYGADQMYNARIFDTQVDNATKLALQQGDIQKAIRLQNMKGQVSNLNTAITASSLGVDPMVIQQMIQAYGNPAGLKFQQGNAQGINKGIVTAEDLLKSSNIR